MTTTIARKKTKTNGKAAKPRKSNVTATNKPANVAAAASKADDWPIRRADRERAKKLLAELDHDDSLLDAIWSLIDGSICRNIGVVMAFAEAMSDEQFRNLYKEITFDELVIDLDRDTRWDLMRELLPALFANEVEAAFDSF